MPDWAIIIISAFGGGIAGAVLQPLLSYFLQRLRANEQIQKTRERNLRRMLEFEIRRGQAAAFEALEAVGRALRVDDVGGREATEPAGGSKESPLWQPHRIEDADLRALARRYKGLAVWLWLAARFGKRGDAETKKLQSSCIELEEVERQITLRMDELKWPEVDE